MVRRQNRVITPSKGPRKSAFYLLFILPKSSFGSHILSNDSITPTACWAVQPSATSPLFSTISISNISTKTSTRIRDWHFCRNVRNQPSATHPRLDKHLPFHEFPEIWNHELWLKCLGNCEKAGLSKTGVSCRRLFEMEIVVKRTRCRLLMCYDLL